MEPPLLNIPESAEAVVLPRLTQFDGPANMGTHMKTTIEIADDLLVRAQKLARQRKTTLRALTEEGLRIVLSQEKTKKKELPPLVTYGGEGLTDEFKDWNWDKLRDEMYRGRGA